MAAHNDFGRDGEQMAAEWLIEKGFRLLKRNWRYGRYELDIIANQQDILHFIEVKSRHDDLFGHPEDWVDRRKGRFLMKVGEAFLEKYPEWTVVQYDILSILFTARGKPEFFFIEDVYWW